jgi:hypothetical protein
MQSTYQIYLDLNSLLEALSIICLCRIFIAVFTRIVCFICDLVKEIEDVDMEIDNIAMNEIFRLTYMKIYVYYP